MRVLGLAVLDLVFTGAILAAGWVIGWGAFWLAVAWMSYRMIAGIGKGMRASAEAASEEDRLREAYRAGLEAGRRMTQQARDEFRARFLLESYRRRGVELVSEHEGGLIQIGVEVAAEMGLPEAEARDALLWLARKGFIEDLTTQGGGRVALAGQDIAEEWLRKIEATPAATRRIGFDTE